MRPRINVYLEDHVNAQLSLLSKRPGFNKSRIVNDALDKFLNPEQDTKTSTVLIRRLDRMSNSMERLDRNQSIELETLALFIRYFLTITPPLTQADQAAAHALGRERFEAFVAQVGRRLSQDKNLLSEVLESIADTRPDLFTVDPDQTAEKLKSESKQQAGKAEDEADADSDVGDEIPPLRPVIIEEDSLADKLDGVLKEENFDV